MFFLYGNPHVTGEHVLQARVCMYVCVVTKKTKVCDVKLTFTAQWLPYLTPDLTFTDSTFCPHCVFMCSVWISEQTAITYTALSDWFLT
jgi:hypothetical protein